MPLTEADLGYMRQVQAEHRETSADLSRQTLASDGSGGRTRTWGANIPVMVRVNSNPDEIPTNLADRFQAGTAAQISMDLTQDVRSGDRLTVSATEVYELVSEGVPDRWATAQVVWAQRITFAPR